MEQGSSPQTLTADDARGGKLAGRNQHVIAAQWRYAPARLRPCVWDFAILKAEKV